MHPRPHLFVLLAIASLAAASPALAEDLSTYATGISGAQGLAFDPSGILYVTSGGATRGVYKVPAGGGAGTLFASTGFVDPWGIVCDGSGDMYVADRGNLAVANSGKIMKVTSTGVVTTFKSGLPAPFGLTMDTGGNLYTGAYSGQKVLRITPAGVVSDYATGLGVNGNQTYQLEFDALGDLYAGNEDRILRIGPGGSPVTQVVGGVSQAMGFVRWLGDNFIVSTFGFGRLLYASPTRGNPAVTLTSLLLVNQCTDGPMPAGARVNQPVFMTLRADKVYFADQGCNKVRWFALSPIDGPVPALRRSWGTVKAIYR